MTAHSNIIGGSTAGRRIACPGSRILEAAAPEEAPSVHAERGTKLHLAIEAMLSGTQLLTDLTDDDLEALQTAYREFNALVDEDTGFALEVKLPFPGVPGAFGTIDAVVFEDRLNRLTIIDFKFGRTRVSAHDNTQLMFYACCARHKFGHRGIYNLVIIQPLMHTNGSSSTIGNAELDAFEAKVHAALADDTLNVGKHCQWCRASGMCPKQQDFARAALKFGENGESLADALDMIEILEPWIEHVRAKALAHVQSGGVVEGWKLTEGRRSRKWTLDDIGNYLIASGLSEHEVYKRSVISVAEADKRVTLDPDWFVWEPGKPKLAKDEDAASMAAYRRTLEDNG